jgi:hypothetical protein
MTQNPCDTVYSDLNPSHLGSKEASGGIEATDLASIGDTGGITGSFISSFMRLAGERVRAVREALLGFGLSRTQVLQALLQRGDLTKPPSVLRFDEALLRILGSSCRCGRAGPDPRARTGAGCRLY